MKEITILFMLVIFTGMINNNFPGHQKQLKLRRSECPVYVSRFLFLA